MKATSIVAVFLVLLASVAFISIHPTGTSGATSKMYWVDSGIDKVQRANLDGTSIEDVATGLFVPSGISLAVAGGKVYWTDYGTSKIQRKNMDGTGAVDDLFDSTDGLQEPRGIEVDAAGGKMYWVDRSTQKIQRGNMDGTGAVDDLFDSTDGLSLPRGISLDPSGGKMYWTDEGTKKIQRGNMNGTGAVEDLLDATDGLDVPTGIDVDGAGGKFYFTDTGTDKIRRANLDGTGAQDLVTSGLQEARDIAVDASGGKMYWTDNGTNKIQRKNMDGTGAVDDLVTGLSTPDGIDLDIQAAPATATFNVAKNFVPDNPASPDPDVTMALTCTSGTVTIVDATANEQAADTADFTVSGFSAGATCTASEPTTPTGYTKNESNCLAVAISPGGTSACTISNTLVPATATPPATPTPIPTPPPAVGGVTELHVDGQGPSARSTASSEPTVPLFAAMVGSAAAALALTAGAWYARRRWGR